MGVNFGGFDICNASVGTENIVKGYVGSDKVFDFSDDIRFVAVGGRHIYNSRDGVLWSKIPTTYPMYFESVCHGNGKFVAVGTTSQSTSTLPDTCVSSDGISWTISDMRAGGFQKVCFGNGKFVGVSYNGLVHVSSDGLNWSTVANLGSYCFGGICFGAGKFVIIRHSGPGIGTSYPLYSFDGITWNSGSITSGGDNEYLGYGNGRFVALGNSDRRTDYSDDGITWNVGSTDRSAGFYKGACYGNGKFIGIGYGFSIIASDDGISWRVVCKGDFPESLTDVCYGFGRYVAVGLVPATGVNNGSLFYSNDGETWNKCQFAADDTFSGVCSKQG